MNSFTVHREGDTIYRVPKQPDPNTSLIVEALINSQLTTFLISFILLLT